MQLRFAVDAAIICPLLEVAAVAYAFLQAGVVTPICQAIIRAAREGSPHCVVRRALLPEPFGANEDLMRTAEALVEERLREEADASYHHQRAPPEAAA